MAGGAPFGVGKGVGGLLGGVLKDQLKSMALAFRVFSCISFVSAFLYGLYYYTCGVRFSRSKKEDSTIDYGTVEMKSNEKS